MDKKEEFDLEFDFEKEYGFDPNELLDGEEETPAEELDFDLIPDEDEDDEDIDLDDILSDEFMASLGILPEEDDDEEDDDAGFPELLVRQKPVEEEDEDDFPQEFSKDYIEDAAEEEFVPAAEPAFEVEPELGEEFTAAFEKEFPSEQPQEETEEPKAKEEAPKPVAQPRRRRKLSKERMIKEVYLPPIIAGLALILIFTFIGGAISRTVKNIQAEKEAAAASSEAASNALAQEIRDLIAEADVLAAGYDYDAALAKLNSFTGDVSEQTDIRDKINEYNAAKAALKGFDDPASIPNLSFHCLIADPSRAFSDKDWGRSYNANYVTIDEFSKILEQLYANNYVLVDFDSFIVETTGEDGKVTYSTQPIYLPEGKKPLMLTETLVNYELFTVDGDGDGEPDKDGDGFASRLIVDANGNITCEMVDATGNIVTGAYDFVPILENFIKAHPDFSYRGARATLAVSGEDGVFGYRTMHSVKEKKGEDYYNQQVEGAKKIAQALRDAGYTIACYTYANVNYGELSASKIQVDQDNWSKEVEPVLGQVDTIVYAKGSDIASNGAYIGGKYNVLKDEGFRYFIGASTVLYAEVTADYVRQSRIMVTGDVMANRPTTYSDYFNAAEVLNALRGE